MVNWNQVKMRIQNWLDRFFPEYRQVFKDWEGKASLITLREFPLPQDIVSKGALAILGQWKKEVKRAVGSKRAEKLVAYANQSIGLTTGLLAARLELKTLLEQYELYVKQMEEIMKQVEELVSQIPGTQEMLTILGLGL